MSNGSDKKGCLGFFFRKTVSRAEAAQGKVAYQPALLMDAVREKMGIVAGPPPLPGGV